MCAVDYLLKPFREARFKAALARAKEQIRRAELSDVQRNVSELLDRLRRIESSAEPLARKPAAAMPRLVFKVAGEHVFVEPAELAWVEAQGELVKMRVGPHVHLVREPLHAVEKRLDPSLHVRIHRSFIVNAAHIRKITPTLYGDHEVLTRDGARLPMSRTYRDKLKQLLAPPAV
jgi:two-component system LytT family response regulator